MLLHLKMVVIDWMKTLIQWKRIDGQGLKSLAAGFQKITTYHFCAVSVTMVQKPISDKGGLPSCNQSTIITDFETGEIFCSTCGYVFPERIEDSDPEWLSFS